MFSLVSAAGENTLHAVDAVPRKFIDHVPD